MNHNLNSFKGVMACKLHMESYSKLFIGVLSGILEFQYSPISMNVSVEFYGVGSPATR